MTIIRHISELATAVMPGVVADFATAYASAPALAHEVSTRALAEHGAPPRVVWVPTSDEFQGAQKNPRGGSTLQHSLMTRACGVTLVCWAETVSAAEDLVEMLVRHLVRAAGVGAVGITIQRGQWVSEAGASQCGEGYALSITYPVDIRAQAATPPTRPTVTPVLNTAGTGTPGDGAPDSTELP